LQLENDIPTSNSAVKIIFEILIEFILFINLCSFSKLKV